MNIETIFHSWELVALALITPWFLLALFSAFGDATVGFIDEWLLRHISTSSEKNIDAPGRLLLISGFFGIVTSCAVVLVTVITDRFGTVYFTFDNLELGFLAGILEVLWLIPYFYALERGGAINTTPLFQTIPVFSLLIGISFFNEIPTLIHILAALLIIGGAIIVNYSPDLHRLNHRSIVLMLLSSFIISIGYFLFKDGAENGNFVTTLFANGLGMFFFSCVIWISWKPYRDQFVSFIKSFDIKTLILQGTNEGLYTIASVANQLAIVLGPSVMAVSVMNAFHPIFTLLIGSALAYFGSESHQKSLAGNNWILKLGAIILIAIGASLIVI